jgi:hypothetical protein
MLAFALVLVGSTRFAEAACPKKAKAMYKVKIDSAPQGATIYVGDKSCGAIGVTPYNGSLAAGTYPVIIELDGYEPGNRSLKVAKLRTVQELFVQLVKQAEPPRIDVRADADNNLYGAQVILDGQPQGTAPIVLTTTPGRHLLEIKKPGFEPLASWIEAKTDQVQTLAPMLKEVAKPKYGTIVIDADVPDAEIYIDGNKHPDNTPSVINNVIEGVHVIEVRKQPGPPWRQTVTVTANQQSKVRAEIAALLNGGVGVVRVLSDARNATVMLDGIEMGPAPYDLKDVKAGDHIIQVRAPGFQTGERIVTVVAGRSEIVKFDLNPEAVGDTGFLKVVSTVPEADVFIDGAAVGKVPQEAKLAAGVHPVVVRLAGYKELQQSVRIEPGQTVTVQADLKAVGRLRVLSTPSNAVVLINGLPAKDAQGKEVRTPIDVEVETGESVVRIESPGFQPFEQTLMIEGGTTQTVSRELAVAGQSELELLAEQRGLSSFGARTLPTKRSTVDIDLGYPYYFGGRVTVGAFRIAKKFGFDANVAVRTMFSRTELGLGGRVMLVEHEPFSGAVFTPFWYGSTLLDDSGRHGFTWDLGLIGSLTALSQVTISGRAYLEVFSDRHCPSLDTTTDNKFSTSDPIDTCVKYRDALQGDMTALTPTQLGRLNKLVGIDGTAPSANFFDRDGGARFNLSITAELALRQRWNVFGTLEGAFGGERGLFTSELSGAMGGTDYQLYLRLGMTYKF